MANYIRKPRWQMW